MTYQEWIEYAIVEYDVVSKNYNHKVYENMVINKETHMADLIQLSLREVLTMCDGTNYEDRIKRAVMKCVYTEASLEREVRKIMDLFFEV